MDYETPDVELIEINPTDIMTATSGGTSGGEDNDMSGGGHSL